MGQRLTLSGTKNWLLELIQSCRVLPEKNWEKMNKLDEFSYKILSGFRVHCQIDAVIIRDENLCFLLLVHDEKDSDQRISLYEVETLREVGNILSEHVLKKDYFQKTKKIGVEVVSAIGDILAHARTSRSHAREMLVLSPWRLLEEGREDSLLLLSEICFSMKPQVFMEKWSKKRFQIKSRTVDQHLKKEHVKVGTAIGGLWHPPIIFEDAPVLLTRKRIAEYDYKRHKVLLYNNGVIFVVVSDKMWDYYANNQEKAIEILNEIVGTANLFGVRGVSFKREDLLFSAIRLDKMDIVAEMTELGFTPRSLIRQVSTSAVARHAHKSLMTVRKDAILEIVSRAEKLTSDLRIRSYVLTYLDAVTHFHAHEYKTSFLLSWIILEKYIENAWTEVLKKDKVTKKRFKKLTGILWAADDKIECLNLCGVFSKKRYSELMSLKALRNKILHEDKTVDRDTTKRSIDLCKTVILEMTR